MIDKYYPDLSEYRQLSVVEKEEVLRNQLHFLNVGWLHKDHPYPLCEVPELFLDRLFGLCNDCRVKTVRTHMICTFCAQEPPVERQFILNGQLRTFTSDVVLDTRGGKDFFAGSGQVHVRGKNNNVYAAPDKIYHYVAFHHYCPPVEFIDAILASEHPEFSVPWIT